MRAAFAAALCLLAAHAAAQSGSPPGAGMWGGTGGGAGPPYGHERAVPDAPDVIVRRGIDRLAGFLLGAREPDREALRGFLEREIAPHFDFEYMARWAAGPLHRRLDAGQRARFAAKLRGLFLQALARNLGSYARPAPRVDVYPARERRGERHATVHARVATGGAAPAMRLDFRFYRDGSAWRIYDVAANGASAVAYYRNYLGNQLRRHGPDAVLE